MHRPALASQEAVASLVGALLESGGPPAVVRRVGPVVIDSLNAMVARRPRSHVGQEVAKVRPPPPADGDASGAVAGIRRTRGTLAPAYNVLPDHILRLDLAFGCAPVPKRPRSAHLVVPATARLGVAAAQVAPDNLNRLAACARASPHGLTSLAGAASAKNGEPAVCVPRYVNKPVPRPFPSCPGLSLGVESGDLAGGGGQEAPPRVLTCSAYQRTVTTRYSTANGSKSLVGIVTRAARAPPPCLPPAR